MTDTTPKIDDPKNGFNLIHQELVRIRELLETIATAILPAPETHNGKPITNNGKDPEPEPEPEVIESAPEPPKKIPWGRLKGIIDNAGASIAQCNDKTTDEKIEGWLDVLKWALPLIPDEDTDKIKLIQSAIENPSEKDFIPPKPKNQRRT